MAGRVDRHAPGARTVLDAAAYGGKLPSSSPLAVRLDGPLRPTVTPAYPAVTRPPRRNAAAAQTTEGRTPIRRNDRDEGHRRAPRTADSTHLADVPEPSLDEIADGRGVLVKVLRVGVDGTDKELIATPATDHVIETGQAFAWNPSITGAKAEETIVVDEDGPVVVAGAPA